LSALVDETFVGHEIATTTNTADESRVQRKQQFMDQVYVPVQDLDQQTKEYLLASGLIPERFEVPLRNLRMETGIFCEANLALLKEDRELSDAYYALGGAQTVQWEGKEVPMSTIEPALEDSDRAKREEALLRIEMLEHTIMNDLPQIVAVDAFQHWVYEHPEQGSDPDACRATWWGLSQRFFPSIDWSGYEEIASSGWQFVHVYGDPFYYIEYAYAILGALQIWENYLRDPAQAIRQYREALALGATKHLPELYAAAGASFVFDDAVLQRVARLISETIGQLEQGLSLAEKSA